MAWLMHLIHAAGDSGNESGITCRWLLVCGMGPMAAAIVFLIFWVKALIEDNKASLMERIHDLKEYHRSVRKD